MGQINHTHSAAADFLHDYEVGNDGPSRQTGVWNSYDLITMTALYFFTHLRIVYRHNSTTKWTLKTHLYIFNFGFILYNTKHS